MAAMYFELFSEHESLALALSPSQCVSLSPCFCLFLALAMFLSVCICCLPFCLCISIYLCIFHLSIVLSRRYCGGLSSQRPLSLATRQGLTREGSHSSTPSS